MIGITEPDLYPAYFRATKIMCLLAH